MNPPKRALHTKISTKSKEVMINWYDECLLKFYNYLSIVLLFFLAIWPLTAKACERTLLRVEMKELL